LYGVVPLTWCLGLRALVPGLAGTTLGSAFSAGGGLTLELGDWPQRRRDHLRAFDQKGLPAPDLIHLTHAALIAYPRYFDPITQQPCPPEVALRRLADAKLRGAALPKGLALRLLAKAQGYLASYAHLWR